MHKIYVTIMKRLYKVINCLELNKIYQRSIIKL